MKQTKIDLVLLAGAFLSFLIMSAAFLIIPLESETLISGLSVFSFAAGIMFWATLVLSIVFLVILSVRRKQFYKKYGLKLNNDIKRIGLFSFFKNKVAIVVDIVMVICLTALVTVFLISGGTEYICYVFIALSVFTVTMHCLFNGKIYFYVDARRKTFENSTNTKKQVKESRR